MLAANTESSPELDEFRSIEGKKLLLYDGVCGLCNKTVQFILARDKKDLFRFAPLQGKLAHQILRKHGKDPKELSTLYLLLDPGAKDEKLLSKSRAVMHVLKNLGLGWKVLSGAGSLTPALADKIYDRIVKTRYEKHGKYDTCPLPTPEQRKKFVGMELVDQAEESGSDVVDSGRD